MKRSEEIKRGPVLRTGPVPATQRPRKVGVSEASDFLPMMLGRIVPLRSRAWTHNNYYYIIRVSRGSSVPRLRIGIISKLIENATFLRPLYASIRNYPADWLRQIFMGSRAKDRNRFVAPRTG